MKKIAAIAILTASSSFALAANGPAGCGLGTAVIFPDANEWHEHVLAATTNGTSGNQTFGMTSGTLGCEAAHGPLSQGLTQAFIDDNMDQLAADVAVGEGETLNALAEVVGVDLSDRATFAAALQADFDAMFNENATSATALEAMTAAMAADASLQKYLG
ncbi:MULTISPECIES: DUF3015 family protein [unclassified Oceanobacter]|jgi:hypothetical protein|uniref:DUF3015 family protein n=1 Tax=unclassified Oceanobacter TaxID=2620260 RepID=UPI002732F0FB|nr:MULTISPECIES: DUF3015 family protein [unclassified Oceanobacter]MDP2506640.1 DUF3015 family protein [Oceanobacter sp. 3_MG-2023]MDP2548693.1 DUF3015 family protein [Oceanobacter sp. 4_MG-2023]MDP2609251.1 DUF3015 family protein [Oceanobacter sp. 1_MG-2023]MDP2612652.1 DUF3015 family protein [Oceanobacter sp. 2_MG-2023]